MTTANGPGIVTGINTLKESVYVEMQESKAQVELPVAQVTFVPRPKQEQKQPQRNQPRGGGRTDDARPRGEIAKVEEPRVEAAPPEAAQAAADTPPPSDAPPTV